MQRKSLAVLVATGAAQALLWERLPARWPVHWNIHDRPDGFAARSVVGAGLPLAIGAFVWLVVEGSVLVMRRSDRGGAPPELVEVYVDAARGVGLAIAVVTSALALALPLLQPRSSIPIVLGALLVLGGTFPWLTRRARRAVAALRARGIVVPQGYDGLLYRNPDDPRLWVPKIAGVGYTLNFAHRRAYWVFAALLSPTFVIFAAVAILAAVAR